MSRRGRTLLAATAPASAPAPVWALAHLAVPPAAWFLHLNAVYLLVPAACRWGQRWPFLLATVVAVAAMAPSVAHSRRARRYGHDDGLVRFLSLAGVLLGALFAAATVLVGAAALVVDPCR